MAKKHGDTIDKKEKRLQLLEEILHEFDLKGKKPMAKHVLPILEKKGFSITKYTLYNDMTELAINDTFVSDLASKSYSSIIHDCFDTINFAEDKAREILNKEWTRSKSVKKEVLVDGQKKILNEITTTEEMAEPHLKALHEITECAVAKAKLLGGDIIKASAKKWSIQRQSDIDTISKLKQQIAEMKQNAAKH
jgi:hypothetical protein